MGFLSFTGISSNHRHNDETEVNIQLGSLRLLWHLPAHHLDLDLPLVVLHALLVRLFLHLCRLDRQSHLVVFL